MTRFEFAFGMTFLWIAFEVSSALLFGDPANAQALLWAWTTLLGLGFCMGLDE
jgi:hypothetical protein